MNTDEYYKFSNEFLKKYMASAIDPMSACINHGSSGLLLYHTQLFFQKKDAVNLKKVKDLVRQCLKNLQNDFDQTSFFLGPLGTIWTLLIVEKSLGSNILNEEKINGFLDEYFSHQQLILDNSKWVVDYIYGVGGWFVLFPYLNDKYKSIILNIYNKQLGEFNFSTIKKIEYDNGEAFFIENENLLGFSHGLLSIATIIKEYKIQEMWHVYERIMSIVNSNLRGEHLYLPRHIQSDDIKRQDWCHGNLGLLLVVDESQRKRILDSYFHSPQSLHDHGVCHGLGQKILLTKIYPELNIEVKIPQMNLDVSSMNNVFIQTPLIASMALALDLQRDKNFSWWRMFYPTC